MRAVFKKQQTYPGASSPAISGQDNRMLQLVGLNSPATSFAAPNQPGQANQSSEVGGKGNATSTAARRASILLNKVVKQPLRELGSNFSSSTNGQSHANSGANPKSDQTNTSSRLTIRGRAFASVDTNAGSSGAVPPETRASAGEPGCTAGGRPSTNTKASLSAPSGATSQAPPGLSAPKVLAPAMSHTINSSIDITSLSYIPGAKEYHYLGNLSFSFVRETNSVRENGGLNGFIHCFLMEVYAIVRAHVSALGGNAFLSFRLQQSCIFYHSNKNQAQCLISVAGDAVQVTV